MKDLHCNSPSQWSRKRLLVYVVFLKTLSLLVVSTLTLIAVPISALGQIGRPMPVPKAYVQARSDHATIETPEVYELANIILALTKSAGEADGLTRKDTQYHRDVISWFAPFRDHAAVRAAELQQHSDYQRFRDNAFRYCFKKHARIRECVPEGPLWGDSAGDRFTKNLATIEDFARVSGFRKFYEAHRQYYVRQAVEMHESANITKMRSWLENNFATRVDSFRVAISPLIDGWHATDGYVSTDYSFHEAIIFTSAPDRLAASAPMERSIRLMRSIFTEIDHNYVNQVTEQYRDRVESIFSAGWTQTSPMSGYESGELVFNEYMTWGVFLLYAKEQYDTKKFETAKIQVTEFMEQNRGFSRFSEFSRALMQLRSAHPNESVSDLYPAVLAWAELHKHSGQGA
jgi:hypothetical protein